MPTIRISKQYVVEQDEDAIVVEVPASLLALWLQDAKADAGDRIREKLEVLNISETDIIDAIAWARQPPKDF